MPDVSRLVVTSRSADVHVVATDAGSLAVQGAGLDVLPDGTARITSRPGDKKVSVACATGSDVTVATSSGDVVLEGSLGSVMVSTLSGKVCVERAVRLEVRSGSGKVEIDTCAEACIVRTASGRLSVGRATKLEVAGVSGRVDVADVDVANVRVVSAKVAVGTGAGGDVNVHTVSGAVDVTVPKGCCPNTDLVSLTGRSTCDCPEGDDAQIAVRSATGKVRVRHR
jgi:DUF4097 and DUF4098 domain-containing protein YvlB